MKVRLEQVGPHTCLPLPGQIATLDEYGVGKEVEVVWDAARAQLLVRPLKADSSDDGPAAGSIAQIVEDFLTGYESAMKELASL